MGGRARRGQERERAGEAARRRRNERLGYAIVCGLAALLMLGSAYPLLQYARADAVRAELSDCGGRLNGTQKVPCTARWQNAAGGARCEERITVTLGSSGPPSTRSLRVDGCAVQAPAGPAFFAAGAVLLLITGVIALARGLRRAATA
ncbi:hypothetical protein [Actinomadura sp. 21ATH]|uniref:hypothetical protein n=1 Tax=Actinomadura sp. 21ATH TaxID=1735444 RepID=UPI0035C12106